jgi:hypothetical protein
MGVLRGQVDGPGRRVAPSLRRADTHGQAQFFESRHLARVAWDLGLGRAKTPSSSPSRRLAEP